MKTSAAPAKASAKAPPTAARSAGAALPAPAMGAVGEMAPFLTATGSPGASLPSPVQSLLSARLPSGLGHVAPFPAALLGRARIDQDGETTADRAASSAIRGTGSQAGSGADLSGIRVHTGPQAAASARSLGARAYALGQHIVFGAGEYAPDSAHGFHLLAHEVSHVLQQGQFGLPALQRFEARVHESAERVGLTQAGLTNEEVSAVYFGNWMRDLNQIFVPLIQAILPDDVVFSMIAYMAAKKFGRELTPEQFGYYLPSEHIDNPGGLVARDDLRPSQPPVTAAARAVGESRLGPTRSSAFDTPQEDVNPATATVAGGGLFTVDQTGVMAHIRRTNLHVERRLQLAANGGRTPEGMQHFGAALHAIEDLFAHSNYVEICVDRLMRQDPQFLPGVTGQSRNVFTYSTPTGRDRRPVLTTGTFTGTDTQVSIASEIVGFMSRPLPPPTNDAEKRVQERFMIALLQSFDTQLRSNPALRRAIRDVAVQNHLPGFVADQLVQLPLAAVYTVTTIFHIPIPNWVREQIQAPIRQAVSDSVLQPAARQLQSESLDARIADTSLLQFMRDNLRVQAGQFTPNEQRSMATRERLFGTPQAQQRVDRQAEAGRHVTALQATPTETLAGPSHSQIAKDHPNSSFDGIAFGLATVAVRAMGDAMLAAWNERAGQATTAYEFGRNSRNWPVPATPPAGSTPEQILAFSQAMAQSRDLFAGGAPRRATEERKSLTRGNEVVTQGGVPGQAFDLATMRRQAADAIREVGTALRLLAASPGTAQVLLTRFNHLLARMTPQLQERVNRQLQEAAQAAGTAAASQQVATLDAVATQLTAVATRVEAARTHPDRAAANAALVTQRQAALVALARSPAMGSALAGALLTALDGEIQQTAVAYTTEQRNVLEGRAQPQGVTSPRALATSTITLPPIATGHPATDRLLAESRRLIAHPFENTWWEPIVRAYATQFPDRLMNDIEARNEGVPFYRGTQGGHGHGHP